jgi:hypothetical protein
MNDTINDKQSNGDGGAVGKPAVRRSLFRRLNWIGFVACVGLSLWAEVWWPIGLFVSAYVLIEGRHRLVRDTWEYGTCAGKKARRHTGNGNVQFVLWRKGDQKEVDGIGHFEDKWVDFDRSWWSLFVSDDCA